MDVRFLIIGLLFLAMGVYYICRMVKSGANCKIPAEATIVKVDLVKRRSGGKRKRYYVPVVKFYAGGKHIEGSTDIESIWATKYREGQTLEIRYNENNPEEFVVKGKSFGSNLLIAGAGIILGATLIVLSFKK